MTVLTPITSDQLLILNSENQRSELFLAFTEHPPVIFRCVINQTFATHDQVYELTYDTPTGVYTDVIPGMVTIGGLQRILQNLVNERVSIRDLATILEGIAEAATFTRNITTMTQHVRTRLARQICDAHTGSHGHLPLATLQPRWEQAFAESLMGDGEEKQLAMAPSILQEFITSVREAYDKFTGMGESPVLLTSPMIRPYVRSVIERFRPQTVVMSQAEIHPKARIKTIGQI